MRISPRLCVLTTMFLFVLATFRHMLRLRSRPRVNYDYEYDSLSEGMFEQMYPMYDMKGVNCKGILENDNASMEYALSLLDTPPYKGLKVTDFEYQSLAAKSCERFIRTFGYITSVLTEDEENFPLAYSIMVYKELEPIERLFRAIYRPQNIYCIHVDSKAKPEFFKAISTLISCFPNAFIAPKRVDVQWSEFTVLEPELICMEELYKRHAAWRYFINLTGEEYPLKSNRELVEILLAYKGANDVEGVRKKANKFRWDNAGPPPPGITPTKGGVHVALNRQFVKFVLGDKRSQALQEWGHGQEVFDETFFSTLNHNPQLGIPGSFMGLDDLEAMGQDKPWFGRYKMWGYQPCAAETQRVHGICILTTGDLPRMHQSPNFFANKFHLHEDRIVYGCLEQRLFNNTREIHMGRMKVNTTIYEQSIIVKNRLVKEDKELQWHPKSDQGFKAEFEKNYGVRKS